MRSILLYLTIAVFGFLHGVAASAQSLPNTPACQRYLAYVRGAGAPGTLGPLYQLYNACMASGRGGASRPSGRPAGSTDCGGGRYCKAGLKCASGGKCIEKDVADCGKGQFCAAGNKCAKQGGCLPKDAVDCGTFSCGVGNACAANKKCVTEAHAQRLRGGGPLNAKAAESVRPTVAVLAGPQSAAKLGYKPTDDWQSILKERGKTKTEIADWSKAGVRAQVYGGQRTAGGGRHFIVAFRGPEPNGLSGAPLRDWIKSNWPQQVAGATPEPYARAAELAQMVQQKLGSSDKLSVTGSALGAALASFVGQMLKVETVTVNAPTASLAPIPRAGEEAAANQTNLITAGDPISDPLADADVAKLGATASPLPGQTYVIEPGDASDGKPTEPKSILKYVEELARDKKGAQ